MLIIQQLWRYLQPFRHNTWTWEMDTQPDRHHMTVELLHNITRQNCFVCGKRCTSWLKLIGVDDNHCRRRVCCVDVPVTMAGRVRKHDQIDWCILCSCPFVYILSTISFAVTVFFCPGTDISATMWPIGMKFCTVVELYSRSGFYTFGGDILRGLLMRV